MDKYERRVRIDQITSLAEKGEFTDAMDIADTIDWRNERSIRTLRVVSEVYKVTKRYEDAFQVLAIAYRKDPDDPIKRKIVYDLCELAIKMNQLGYAIRYLEEFMKLSPDDPDRYALQYRMLLVTEASKEERIELLEEFRGSYFRDFTEKWAFELATLYHQTGQSQKCINACDEIILCFVSGPYVTRAKELKMKYLDTASAVTGESQPFYYEQQNGYGQAEPQYYGSGQEAVQGYPAENAYPGQGGQSQPMSIEVRQVQPSNQPTIRMPDKQVLPEFPDNQAEISVNVDKFSTINLQAELKANIDELQERTGEPIFEQEERIPAEPDSGMTEILPEEQNPEAEDEQPEEQPDKRVILEPMQVKTPEAVKETPTLRTLEKQNVGEHPKLNKPEDRSGAFDKPAATNIRYQVITPDVFKNSLSESPDGQMTMNIPDGPAELEKQITGQMDLGTVLAQWDKIMEEGQQKRLNEARRKSFEQTNDIVKQMEKDIPGYKIPAMTVSSDVPKFEVMRPPKLAVGDKTGEIIKPDLVKSQAEEEQVKPEPVQNQAEDQPVMLEQIPEEEAQAGQEIVREPERIPEEEAQAGPEPVRKKEPEKVPVIQAFAAGAATGGEDDPEEEGRDETPKDLVSFEEVHPLTEAEQNAYGPFLLIGGMQERLERNIAKISMTGSHGNVVITGSEAALREGLVQAVVSDQQMKNPELGSRVAKIDAEVFNTKNIEKSLHTLDDAVLVIGRAGRLSDSTIKTMISVLAEQELTILVILEDTRNAMRDFPKRYASFSRVFNVMLDIPKFTNDDLVSHAQDYANEREYIIDDLGKLALYSRIDERQTADHLVTLEEVEEIVDAAIRHVDKKNVSHLMDVLFGKRYNKEDFIIIREKDFVRRK
ncbi:MAG: tetratricopeptide repeat protein [Lachnospiraceae bacterium]|nr:tetratricopeptide repeat protein [Lachnospiraceae bacterium]